VQINFQDGDQSYISYKSKVQQYKIDRALKGFADGQETHTNTNTNNDTSIDNHQTTLADFRAEPVGINKSFECHSSEDGWDGVSHTIGNAKRNRLIRTLHEGFPSVAAVHH